MSLILFLVSMFLITLIYVYIGLGTNYLRSIEGYVMLLVSYACWVYLDVKYILVGLIDHDFTRILSILDVLS